MRAATPRQLFGAAVVLVVGVGCLAGLTTPAARRTLNRCCGQTFGNCTETCSQEKSLRMPACVTVQAHS
eukprot:1158341-Pelagomonas_calceolata.AAC.2